MATEKKSAQDQFLLPVRRRAITTTLKLHRVDTQKKMRQQLVRPNYLLKNSRTTGSQKKQEDLKKSGRLVI